MIQVKIDILKAALHRMLHKLEKEDITDIVIEDDLYNIIPTDEWSIINNPKDVVVIGSLQDDYDNLEKLALDSHRPCTYVDFDRLASILRAISQKQNPPDQP